MSEHLILLGVFGGLLFLALLLCAILLAAFALLLGWIGSRWLADVQRVEAMRGKHETENSDE